MFKYNLCPGSTDSYALHQNLFLALNCYKEGPFPIFQSEAIKNLILYKWNILWYKYFLCYGISLPIALVTQMFYGYRYTGVDGEDRSYVWVYMLFWGLVTGFELLVRTITAVRVSGCSVL
jgi:hypothetical protein